MEAVFYSLNKRRNSTKQPSDGGTSLNVELKAATNLRSPIFIIGYSGLPSFNYVAFNNQYFWIDSIESIRNNVWAVHCSIDVLATYKSNILASSAFIVYDTTSNTEIVDGRIPVKSTPTVTAYDMEFPFSTGTGSYLLTVTGKGSVDTFVINRAQLSALLSDMQTWTDNLFPPPQFSNPTTENVLEYIANLIPNAFSNFLAAGNIPNNIRGCIWVPWTVPTGASHRVFLGEFDTGYTFPIVTDDSVNMNGASGQSGFIPFNDWRRKEPYTQYYLYLPYVGLVHFSADNMPAGATLSVLMSISKRDGTLTYIVKAGSEIVGSYSADSSSCVPVGISNISGTRMAGSIVNTLGAIGTAATGNIPAAAALGLSAASNIVRNDVTIGGFTGSSVTSNEFRPKLIVITHDTIVSPSSVSDLMGTPTYAVKSLSSLTGYVQTDNFSLNVNAVSEDIDEVNTLMNGGVYIE